MGNAPSSPESKSKSSSSSTAREETAADKAKKLVEEVQSSLKQSIRNFDESQSANFLDSICGPVFDDDHFKRNRSYAYSEDLSEEDSRTISDGDNSTMESSRRGTSSRNRKGRSTESGSVFSQSDYESEATPSRGLTPRKFTDSFESEDDSYVERKNREIEKVNHTNASHAQAPLSSASGLSKPLASAFAKRCYFTKAGIGKTTQHYEGLTLTGNVVLMLAAAMKLKGCPTICDEDLRRVEQTYPNQFSRLPDELLLSSGWRRISKYCHFSNKPVPDGVPFFHSKKRLHPQGGYFFLLAAAVGMIRPIDVEPLTRDTLVLLETDYPAQADAAPQALVQDPNEWTLVDKFCFFSGGPINTEEDVYYQADFDGNPIYMLAFLSPSLTPEELYKLTQDNTDEPGLKSVAAVEDVESVYDLTDRDFDDLKLYHLGPCRALPPYILQPQAWTKVLPPHFLTAKHRALIRAQRWEDVHGPGSMSMASSPVASAQEYNYRPSPIHSGIGVSVPPPMHSPAAAGLPLGTPQSPGMVSPGMLPASPAVYGSGVGTPVGSAAVGIGVSPRNQQPYFAGPQPPPAFSSPEPQYGFPPQAPNPASMPVSPPTESLASATETGQSASMETESFQREVEEEGAFVDNTLPVDEAIALRSQKIRTLPLSATTRGGPVSPPGYRPSDMNSGSMSLNTKMDPPEDEPPSLSRDDIPDDEGYRPSPSSYYTSPNKSADASNSASYYREGEFPPNGESHMNDGRGGYYTREDEYYDSPEQHHRPEGYIPPSGPGGFYPEEDLSPESMQRTEVYGRDPHHHPIVENNHPGYHHGELHPDYHHGGPPPEYQPHSVYHEGPNGEYHPDSRPIYRDVGYHHTAVQGAMYHETEQSDYLPEPPEMYRSVGAADYDYQREREDAIYSNTENEPPGDPFYSSTSPETMASPKSDVSRGNGISEASQSSAMRTAQELLKRNRAKRIDAERRKETNEPEPQTVDEPSVGNEWSESGSEMTSVISGSSVWTDTSNANERSSRRALILQMAKARMKQNKNPSHTEDKTYGAIVEESSVQSSNRDTSRTEANASECGGEDLELD